jgi:hypothetical protein
LSFTKEQFPSLHHFSLDQYYELGELGLLDRRTELLDGVIIDMEPVSPLACQYRRNPQLLSVSPVGYACLSFP